MFNVNDIHNLKAVCIHYLTIFIVITRLHLHISIMIYLFLIWHLHICHNVFQFWFYYQIYNLQYRVKFIFVNYSIRYVTIKAGYIHQNKLF